MAPATFQDAADHTTEILPFRVKHGPLFVDERIKVHMDRNK